MKRYLQILFLLLFCSFQLLGQSSNSVDVTLKVSIPEVALVDIQGTTQLTNVNSPNNGQTVSVEQVITPSIDNNTWLNYSSIVPEGVSNYISVSIISNLPSSISIHLSIGDDVNEGNGATGIPSAEITLTDLPKNIITGIGSCYTGRGMNKGHQLFFSLVDENPDIAQGGDHDYNISVTYTIASTI